MAVPQEANKRSLDSLQRIYSVIIALAITTGLKNFLSDSSEQFHYYYERLPMFVALFLTAVPFVHGMNRHLDKTLARIIAEPQKPYLFRFIVFDFIFFSVESCIFYILAFLVKGNLLTFFTAWLAVHVTDSVWIAVTLTSKPNAAARRSLLIWLTINGLVFVATLAVIRLIPGLSCTGLLLMTIAVVRTIADYALGWGLYFPTDSTDEL
jgi:hypothetical protein